MIQIPYRVFCALSNAITPVVPKASPDIVATCVLIEATKTDICFSGATPNVGIRLTGPCTSDRKQSVIVPAEVIRSVARVARDVKPNEVSIEIEGRSITFACGKYLQAVTRIPREDEFPRIVEVDRSQINSRFHAKYLFPALNSVQSAIDYSISFPAMRGVHINGHDVVACTSQRMHIVRLKQSTPWEPFTAPADWVSAVVKVAQPSEDSVGVADYPDPVSFWVVDGRIQADIQQTTDDNHRISGLLVGRGRESKFPDYRQMIPDDEKRVVSCTVDREDLSRTIANVSQTVADFVTISIADTSVVVSASNVKSGVVSSGSVPLHGDHGKAQHATFNASGLLDALQSYVSHRVTFGWTREADGQHTVAKIQSEDEVFCAVVVGTL